MDNLAEVTLKVAVEQAGGVADLATAVGVTRQAVYKWLRCGRVPVARLAAVEAASGFTVTRAMLRPDVFVPGSLKPLEARS